MKNTITGNQYNSSQKVVHVVAMKHFKGLEFRIYQSENLVPNYIKNLPFIIRNGIKEYHSKSALYFWNKILTKSVSFRWESRIVEITEANPYNHIPKPPPTHETTRH